MINIELFINDVKMDLFRDESIQITDSIQIAQDVGKIFTSYSETFTLPATPKNNDFFSHYYNQEVVNGYDARVKQPAVIKVNGFDKYKGFIELNDVKLKYNKPVNYTIYFTGEVSELKSIFKDDLISELPLSQYDHVYSEAVVKDAIQGFRSVNTDGTLAVATVDTADISYPFITHSKRYVYTTDLFEVETNSDGTDGNVTTNNLDFSQIKPALRLNRIVEAIEEKYSLTFDSSFFDNTLFTYLYMWLHRSKGGFEAGDGFQLLNLIVNLTDMDFDTGIDVLPSDGVLVFFSVDSGIAGQSWELDYNVTFTGSGQVNIAIYDDFLNANVFEQNNVDVNNNTLNFNYNYPQPPNGQASGRSPQLIIQAIDSGVTGASVQLDLTQNTWINFNLSDQDTGAYDWLSGASQNPVNTVIIREQIPKMKVIDFLTSIFKTFNLTAFVKDNGNIFVETLDFFYEQGNTIDITNQIDIRESTVSRLKPFNDISFKYADPKTFLILNRNSITNTQYGDLEYNVQENAVDNAVFGGGTYNIETKFSKVLYERLIDESNVLTNICYGMYLDEKLEPSFGDPLIFYNMVTQTPNTPIHFEGDATDYTVYNRPSNSYQTIQTINFGSEIDEYSLETNNNSLFNTYYATYINRVFNPLTRYLKIKGYMNPDFILDYALNDTLIVNNKRYNINDIRINLNTREAELNLINIIDTVNLVPITLPEAPNSIKVEAESSTEALLTWLDPLPDNVDELKIKLDGADVTTIALGNERYVLTGLSLDTEYTAEVLTVNDDSNESSSRLGVNKVIFTLTEVVTIDGSVITIDGEVATV